jgi:hypothetical protein
VQNYIYWLISTENDHRHHHKFIKYEKRLRKEGNMLGLPINNNSAWDLTRSTSLGSLHPTATVQLIPYITVTWSFKNKKNFEKFWSSIINKSLFWKKLEKKYAPALDNYGQNCFVRSDFLKIKCVCKTQMMPPTWP